MGNRPVAVKRSARRQGAADSPPARPCPLERYLEVISGMWVPRIIWHLLERPRRFGELRRGIDGVSAKVLTVKLRMLEREKLVQRTVLPASPPRVEYALTERGHALEPVFRAMEEASRRLFPAHGGRGRTVMPRPAPAEHLPRPASAQGSERAQ